MVSYAINSFIPKQPLAITKKAYYPLSTVFNFLGEG
jgi:hypothetical protein